MALDTSIQWVRYDLNADGRIVRIVQGGTVSMTDDNGVTMVRRVKIQVNPRDDDVQLSRETNLLITRKNREQFALRAAKAIAPQEAEE